MQFKAGEYNNCHYVWEFIPVNDKKQTSKSKEPIKNRYYYCTPTSHERISYRARRKNSRTVGPSLLSVR